MATTITAGNATNGLAFSADNTGAFEFKTGTGAGTTAMSISATGNVSGVLKSGTAVTASGTSIEFTSIPSTVKRITVMFSGFSTTANVVPLIQIGSGGFTTTGYLSYVTNSATAATAASSGTTGFVFPSGNLANLIYATYVLTNLTGNTWTASLSGGMISGATVYSMSGGGVSPSLSGALDRLRIYIDGTNTFDAGSINILYE